MAYACTNHRRALVPGPQFFDLQTAIPAPLGFPPGSFGVVNPNLRPVVPQIEVLVPVTPPAVAPFRFTVNPAILMRMDEERTQSLLQFMANDGLVPSAEEESKRTEVIANLKQILLAWIKKVAWQRRFPRRLISSTSATILTYGSYGLGVHGSESDVDALCVGPSFATMNEDFFIVLRNMLQNRPEVSEIHCVKDAKVPLMRFKFNGISVDLPYAKLKVNSVPEDLDILNPFFLMNIDDTSWRSLSGVRANIRILQLVPNIENFQAMLRCLKLWAKRRGVYGNLHGFLGGIHMAVLAAYVCQLHPNASINILISKFFETFALWRWPTPVMLQDEMAPMGVGVSEVHSLMPIMLPCSSREYCHSNITKSTFNRIRSELLRGHAMTRDFLRPDFAWSTLVEHFQYTKKYVRFVRVFLSASDQDELGDWVGWVKSRFRVLILKVEEAQGLCDPNPTEYVDPDVADPNVVFYWGLQPGRSRFTDVDYVEEDFIKSINHGFQGPRGIFELSIVEASALSKNVKIDSGTAEEPKACWRMPEYNRQMKPIYSQHMPHYFVGYVAKTEDRG
ncbi:nuclear poly(A) polymerase 3 [Macadamia integrifolia]|uniref:nuclear poly(A) polymerase 3 n=1 Tax=Macadamia integrifolia TaxID=60698 RepID=UPI001C4F430B|nr:nuclear poly(A) polymerase 3 [Macadamia integrifolia]